MKKHIKKLTDCQTNGQNERLIHTDHTDKRTDNQMKRHSDRLSYIIVALIKINDLKKISVLT